VGGNGRILRGEKMHEKIAAIGNCLYLGKPFAGYHPVSYIL